MLCTSSIILAISVAVPYVSYLSNITNQSIRCVFMTSVQCSGWYGICTELLGLCLLKHWCK